MKVKLLNDLLEIDLPFNTCQILETAIGRYTTPQIKGSSFHILFHSPSHKQKYLASTELLSTHKTITIDCGLNPRELEVGQQLRYVVDKIGDLLLRLQSLLQDQNLEIVLQHLVIDNLSHLLWTLGQETNKYQEISQLISLFKEIQCRYDCSILVFSWDACFDKGVGYNWNNANTTVEEAATMGDLSHWPATYLDWFTNVLHLGQEIRYWNKTTKHWDIITADVT